MTSFSYTTQFTTQLRVDVCKSDYTEHLVWVNCTLVTNKTPDFSSVGMWLPI